MYKLTHVTKLYQKGRHTVPAVRDLSLVIEDGEWLAVQGRTGHGTSTLLNLLGGLGHPRQLRRPPRPADRGDEQGPVLDPPGHQEADRYVIPAASRPGGWPLRESRMGAMTP